MGSAIVPALREHTHLSSHAIVRPARIPVWSVPANQLTVNVVSSTCLLTRASAQKSAPWELINLDKSVWSASSPVWTASTSSPASNASEVTCFIAVPHASSPWRSAPTISTRRIPKSACPSLGVPKSTTKMKSLKLVHCPATETCTYRKIPAFVAHLARVASTSAQGWSVRIGPLPRLHL